MKRKKVLILIGILLAVTGLGLRIWYVNTHTYSPEIREVPQGQTAEYCGLSYTIVNAEMWNSSDFYTQHPELTDYQNPNIPADEMKLLVVEYQIGKVQEANKLDLYIPIQYAHLFNGTDPFMTQDMNPSLSDGNFQSGDTVVIPYEIYKANLSEEQWKDVENGSMEYETVLGTYPVKTEMKIQDIRYEGERCSERSYYNRDEKSIPFQRIFRSGIGRRSGRSHTDNMGVSEYLSGKYERKKSYSWITCDR